MLVAWLGVLEADVVAKLLHPLKLPRPHRGDSVRVEALLLRPRQSA
jgi:hypothetical protein